MVKIFCDKCGKIINHRQFMVGTDKLNDPIAVEIHLCKKHFNDFMAWLKIKESSHE